MNSRLDGLAEQSLTAEMQALRRDLDELKNRQRTSGRSGVLTYLTATANDPDVTLNFTLGTYGSLIAEYGITFTGDGSQDFPAVELFLDRSSSVSAPASDVQINLDFDVIELDLNYLEDPTATRWIFTVRAYNMSTNTKTCSVTFKPYIYGTSPGTVSIVRLS